MITYNFKSLILMTLLFVTFTSCEKQKKTVSGTKEEVLPNNIVELSAEQVKLANIQTGSIELRSMSGTLKVSGVVATAPQNMAMVSMPMGGFVKSTTLMPGNQVSKGQTLAVIENSEFIDIQQNFLETKTKLEYAEADFNRQKELYKNDISSQKNLQLVASEYKSLKIKAKSLEQKLSILGINPDKLNENTISKSIALVSPISGYVKTVNVSIGKSVSASDVLFEIVNSDKLFIQLTLFEKDADKATTGQKIRFFINDETEQHQAIIYQTAKSIDSDKTYKVFASVQGACKNVLPGMYVNAIIEGAANKVTAVPSEAIVSFEDKDYIFVFERNKMENNKSFTEYRMVEVKKGVTDRGFTEITLPDNFNINDAKLVVKGAYNLLSAMKNAGEMAC